MATDGRITTAEISPEMNDKKAYEAFRVRHFASAHPILQAARDSCQTAQQPQLESESADVRHGGEGTLADACKGAAVAMLQQQLPPDHQRVIIHFDVDCFYCQVEEVRNPSLRGRPVAVTQKYLVVTANYEARAAGVTKLMGIADARKACPQLILVPGEDLSPYRAASSAIRAVLSRWGPCEKLGLDESWVDVTQEVLNRLASGAVSSITPSLTDAADQWPAHIYNSSMALTADSKHRPQDLRVAAAAAPSAPLTAAAASEQGVVAHSTGGPHPTCAISTGAAADVADDSSGADAMQVKHDTTACTTAAAAAAAAFAPSDNSEGGLSLSDDWQPKLYVGCVIAAEMREAVLREAGYRCSAGIAFNKLLSKLVSGLHKPNDQTALPPTEAQACVARLPVRALRGVGYKAETVLKGWGVVTAGDVAALSKQQLIEGLGERQGLWLHGACRGVDPSPVVPSGAPKSISVEDSFKGCSTWTQINAVLKVLVPDLVERLQEDEQEHGPRKPSTLSVKWRKAGTGWHRTSASAPWPSLHIHGSAAAPTIGLLGPAASGDVNPAVSQLVNPTHIEVVTAAALKLLKQHLTGSFNLTLLSVGVTGFKDAAAAAATAAGAGGIKRFFQQTEVAAPQAAVAIPVAPSTAASAPDASALLQSALSSTAARRSYAAMSAAAESGAVSHAASTQQQQCSTAAATAGPVLLSKRQERRLLEQAVLQQQGVLPCGQRGQQQQGQQQQLILRSSPPVKRMRVPERRQQQQQIVGLQQQLQQATRSHPAVVWQHPQQQQQQQQQKCSFQDQQQHVGSQRDQLSAPALQHPEHHQCHQQIASLQEQQQRGAGHRHRQQQEQQQCEVQQQIDMESLQQRQRPAPDDRATADAQMCGSMQAAPDAAAGCAAFFELHDLGGWGSFSCEVVEGFEEDGDASDGEDL